MKDIQILIDILNEFKKENENPSSGLAIAFISITRLTESKAVAEMIREGERNLSRLEMAEIIAESCIDAGKTIAKACKEIEDEK